MKKKYKCDNCGFSFTTEKDAVKCPYCDKDSLTLEMGDDEEIQDIDSFLK